MTDVDELVAADRPVAGAVEAGFTPPSAQGERWPAIVLPPLLS